MNLRWTPRGYSDDQQPLFVKSTRDVNQPTFSESPQPYDAIVAITKTPRAPAPENWALLLPNTESKAQPRRITNLLRDLSACWKGKV